MVVTIIFQDVLKLKESLGELYTKEKAQVLLLNLLNLAKFKRHAPACLPTHVIISQADFQDPDIHLPRGGKIATPP